ncbi:MAG: hypothetical protein ACI9TV_001904 [Sulfurimonas sp.]|jgi:hypothetical protein|uniref:hypothetical protein n=1 Tax=Sulfurimonas sp. TaxID=2022749 RepID=UPI0039E62EE9
MNITKYFSQLNKTSQEIFNTTMTDSINLGKTHSISSFIVEFSECLFEKEEKKMLRTVAIQLETATLNLSLGLYRQAFSSLRLAFEMGLGLIHFSINKLEHNEWLNGENDIKWAKLINEENGVLSKRFSKAFFYELEEIINEYNGKAKKVYREMSEYVHGNSDTWQKSGLSLKYNEELKNKYFELFKEVSEILLFVLNCRYLKSFDADKIDSISEFLIEDLGHITEIREFLNGAKV